MRSDDLAELVRAAQGGDDPAFAHLVERAQRLAVGLAVGWLGDVELAREVAQEAFLDAHLHLRDLRDPTAFVPWFRRVVAKHCGRLTRRVALRRSSLADAELVADDAPVPEEAVERREEARIARAALERLPARERVVVALQYLGGYRQPEIARLLDLPLTMVKKRAHDARARLREELTMVETRLTEEGTSGLEKFPDQIKLFLAVRRGDAATVASLLSRRPGLVAQHESWSDAEAHRARLPYAREATPLIRAAERGDLAIARLLVDAGAAVDDTCGCATGETPLWAAAVTDYPEVVAFLLDRGANPNAPGALGHTALHIAAMRGWPNLAQTLLTHGADPNLKDEAGRTPLEWAELKGHAEVAALLREWLAGWANPTLTPPHVGEGRRESGVPSFRDARQAIARPRPPLPDAGRGRRGVRPAGDVFPRSAALDSCLDPSSLGLDGSGNAALPERRPANVSAPDVFETGMKVVDLFAPFCHGDLVLVDGDFGLGLVVLLGELTVALREGGYGHALWTGFQEPMRDVRELDHALGESGRRDLTRLALVPNDEAGEAEEALRRILNQWEGDLTQSRQRRLVVVFQAAGLVAAVEALQPSLTRSDPGAQTAIVVAPEVFPSRGTTKPEELPPGVAAHLRFDAARARRGLYPALKATALRSARLVPEIVGAEHVAVVDEARRLLARYERIDPDLAFPEAEALPPRRRATAVRAQLLHAFLTQPFVFAEPFTGRTGVRVSRQATVEGVSRILDGQVDDVPVSSLRYRGGL